MTCMSGPGGGPNRVNRVCHRSRQTGRLTWFDTVDTLNRETFCTGPSHGKVPGFLMSTESPCRHVAKIGFDNGGKVWYK